MGFFDFLKKKEELLPVQEEDVLIGDIEDWFSSNFNNRVKELISKSDKIHKDVISGFDHVKTAVKKLDKASFEKEDKIYARVNMVKSGYTRRASSLLGSVKDMETELNYNILKDFYDKSSNTLKNLKEISPKQATLMSNYFRRESNELIKGMSSLDNTISSLKEFLDQEGRILETKINVKEGMEKHKSLQERASKLESDENEIKKKIEETENKVKTAAKELESFLNSSRWDELDTLKTKIDSLKNETFKIEYQIRGDLSYLKRPLKKAKHIDKNPAIEAYIKAPFKEFVSDGGEAALGEIISLLNIMINRGKLSLKDKESSKIKELQSNMEAISDHRNKYLNLVKERRETEAKLKEFDILYEEKTSYEESIERTKKEKESLKADMKGMQRKMNENDEEMKENIKGMESAIFNKSNRKVNIRV
jgi:hypothetical protein